jgi:hypothetical protein
MVAMAAAATTRLRLLRFITLEPSRDRHVLQVLGRSQGDGRRHRDGTGRADPLAELAGALADAGDPVAAGAEVVHRERQRRRGVEEHLRGRVDELGQRPGRLAFALPAARRQPRRRRLQRRRDDIGDERIPAPPCVHMNPIPWSAHQWRHRPEEECVYGART